MWTILCGILTVLVCQKVDSRPPPVITGSYIAWGEITQPVKDMEGYEVQVLFEETYDADTQNSAFVVWMLSQNVTFIKNFKTNETFKYTMGKVCETTDEAEWMVSDYPPGLLAYEDNNGTMRFSLSQLFNLPDRFLVKDQEGLPTIYRNIPALSWMHEIPSRDEKGTRKRLVVYSYWSDGTWNTSSNGESVPLGFSVAKMGWTVKNMKVEETITSVFGFVSGTYHRKLLQPVQGIICPNRTQTLKFPNVRNLNAISFHSEMVLPDYQEIRYIDTWFVPGSQLLRVDAARLRDEDPIAEMKEKRYESEVAIGKIGVVFRQSVFKDQFKCEIISMNKYQNDIQNFIDVKQNLSKWTMGRLFGLNDTNYVYIGKTTKADIPCHVFQGIRKDWPERSANVTSLWEWCFNVNMSKLNDIVQFRDDELGLINAQVTILTSDQPQIYPLGFRMFHHFYEVSSKDRAILEATSFDISRCFNETYRRALQFHVDWEVTAEYKHIAENLTSDVRFLMDWKAAIYQHTKLPDYSQRIAKMRATIDDQKLYIKFLLLEDYNKITTEIWTDQIPASQAENNLRDSINSGKVFIYYYTLNKKEVTLLKAKEKSLSFQIDPDITPVTMQPIDSTTQTMPSTFPPFTLLTAETHKSKSPPTDVTGPVSPDGTTGTVTTDDSTGTVTTDDSTGTVTTDDSTGTVTTDDSTGTVTTDDSTGTVTTDDSTGTVTTDGGNTGSVTNEQTGPTTPGTVSTDGSTTEPTGPTPTGKVKRIVKTGHQPGAVAAVSIAMLLVGISIGSMGTFYKFKGLPECLQKGT